MKKILIIPVVVFLSVAVIIFALQKATPQTKNKAILPILRDMINPFPTPFLFQEMTIPHLRGRVYKSSLNELEEIANNGEYNSYLTSYNSDGLRVNGLLTRPNADLPEGGWPAIVFIHGYIPPTQYQTLSQYSAYVDYLAREGFVVFKIDLRGHGDSEGEPGGAYYSSDYIIDALNAHAALASSDFVNPNKIGLWGHSMAGNVVFRSVAVKKDIPAVVIWAGAVYSYEDFQKYRLNDGSYRPPSVVSQRNRRRQMLFDTHGEFSTASPFWKQVAATNYLSDIKSAIQLHHSEDDTVVNPGYSRDLKKLLENTSISHELHEYPGGGHNILGDYFNQAMERTAEFFKKSLQ